MVLRQDGPNPSGNKSCEMRSEKNSYLWKVPTPVSAGMRQDWNLLVIHATYSRTSELKAQTRNKIVEQKRRYGKAGFTITVRVVVILWEIFFSLLGYHFVDIAVPRNESHTSFHIT
jgi:hypothetical protein